MSLLCMALAGLGVDATSYTGSQAGIITDAVHTKAKIVEIRADRLQATLAAGGVPVVAGFQGMSTSKDITTLGPRRVGYHRSGPGRRPVGRCLRDLHRRARGVQHRSRIEPAARQAGPGQLRGDA